MNATLGPYHIVKKIADGGAAEILLATRSGAGKHYALKALHPAKKGDKGAESRLLEEARLSAQLRHANIVSVHDVDHYDGRLVIVMEHIAGQDLHSLLSALRTANLTIACEVGAYIGRQLCDGLHYAHSRKDSDGGSMLLVHRQIAPSNIVVGVNGDVKIIDFSGAQARGQDPNLAAPLHSHKLASYMSPEQMVGKPQDSRTDIFCAGLVLYELLAGRPAYDEARIGPAAMIDAVRNAKIRPPSSVRSKVPPELDRITMKALRANPDERYQNAMAMQRELAEYLAASAPKFSSKHFAAYLSRLLDRVGLSPDLSPAAPGDAADGASPSKDEWAVASTDVGIQAQTGAPIDDSRFPGGGPQLSQFAKPSRGFEGPSVEAAPRLLTQSGFNRVVQPDEHEEKQARISELPQHLRRQAMRGDVPVDLEVDIEPLAIEAAPEPEPTPVVTEQVHRPENAELPEADPDDSMDVEVPTALLNADAVPDITEPTSRPPHAALPQAPEHTEPNAPPPDAQLPGPLDVNPLGATEALVRPSNESLPEDPTPAGLSLPSSNLGLPQPKFTNAGSGSTPIPSPSLGLAGLQGDTPAPGAPRPGFRSTGSALPKPTLPKFGGVAASPGSSAFGGEPTGISGAQSAPPVGAPPSADSGVSAPPVTAPAQQPQPAPQNAFGAGGFSAAPQAPAPAPNPFVSAGRSSSFPTSDGFKPGGPQNPFPTGQPGGVAPPGQSGSFPSSQTSGGFTPQAPPPQNQAPQQWLAELLSTQSGKQLAMVAGAGAFLIFVLLLAIILL